MPGDQHVQWIGALGIGGDRKARILFQGDVFRTVDGDVDLAGEEGARDRRDEDAFTRRHVDGPYVSFGHHRNDLHLMAGAAEPLRHQLALDERQLRAPRS